MYKQETLKSLDRFRLVDSILTTIGATAICALGFIAAILVFV